MIPLLRPRHVAIFRTDPTGAAGVIAQIQAFMLTEAVAATVPGRARLDLTRSVTVNRSYDVSRNPMERVIADNVIKRPEVIQVSGMWSATPLASFGGIPLGSLFRFDLMQLEQLRSMQGTGEPLALVIPARPYASVLLTSLTEDHGHRGKVELQLTFEEIEIVSPLSIPVDPDLLAASAYAEAGGGSQPVEDVPDFGGLS